MQRDSAQAAQAAYGTSILGEEMYNNLIPDDEAVYEGNYDYFSHRKFQIALRKCSSVELFSKSFLYNAVNLNKHLMILLFFTILMV